MERYLLRISKQILISAIIMATLPWMAFADTDNTILIQEKARLELEVAIEKAKADIAGYQRTQREAGGLADLSVRQKEAEARKAEAEAEKGEALAKIPSTKIEPLSGSIDAKNFGAAGLIVAVDLAKDIASGLCSVIDDGQRAIIYEPDTTSGILSARLLETQLTLFQDSLDKVLREKDNSRTIIPITAATGTVKAIADLASLFKTNVTVSKTDFPEAKSLLLTAMAGACPKKLTSLGFGYAGELDTTALETLRNKALNLIGDRAKLEGRIAGTKKELAEETDAGKKKSLQARLDDLSSIAKIVDGFIAVIRPNEINDKSPLPIAAKYLALSKRADGSSVLDIDFKLEGLSIIKENIFTGQHLRLSATAITWYRLYDPLGNITKAGVTRRMAKPVQVDLRGDEVSAEFWSKQ